MTTCEPFSDKATASTGSNQGNLFLQKSRDTRESLPLELADKVFGRQGGVLERGALSLCGCGHHGWFEICQIQDKLIRVACDDPERLERLGWEILHIHGNDRMRAAKDGCGEHVSIIGIRQRELLDQRFVAADQTIRNGLVD